MEKWLILGTGQKSLEHLVVMESTKGKKSKTKPIWHYIKGTNEQMKGLPKLEHFEQQNEVVLFVVVQLLSHV